MGGGYLDERGVLGGRVVGRDGVGVDDEPGEDEEYAEGEGEAHLGHLHGPGEARDGENQGLHRVTQ